MFGREEELAQLAQRLASRKSFLLYGPGGVGKTLLLQRAVRTLPPATFIQCRAIRNPGAFIREVCAGLASVGDDYVLSRLKLKAVSSAGQIERLVSERSSLAAQGIVLEALRRKPRMLVCDHAEFVSQPFYRYLKELELQASVPLVAVARSYHMEQLGHLARWFSDWRDRMHLENFDPERAARFAGLAAEQQGLTADNIQMFLDKIVRSSEGNPGAILRMIAMAQDGRYRSGGEIRIHVIWVDYCMQYAPPRA